MDKEALTWPFGRQDVLLPPPEFDTLRAECPVTKVTLWNGSEAWLMTRCDDFKSVLRSTTVSADAARSGFPNSSEYHHAARVLQRGLIRMDPPEHGFYRRMVTAAFSPGRLKKLEPKIEEIVDRLLSSMERNGSPADLLKNFAGPLPSELTCHILDLPMEDSERLLGMVNVWMDLKSTPAMSAEAAQALSDYLLDVVIDREKNPGDDLVSELVREQLRPGNVSLDRLVGILWQIVQGGFDTTTNMITLGTVLLLRHPDQAEALRTDPTLIPNAVEEMLRYLSIVQQVASRVAVQDFTVRGVDVRCGDAILAPIPAANHDPDAFPEPHRFDVRRPSRSHVAFGFGPHQCLGQNLARIELQIAFGKLLERFPDLHLSETEENLRFRDSMNRGVADLLVAW
jgi:cytochrome P450